MKTRFSTYDLICSVTELQKLIGLRVVQVYDIDNKTYLIKLQRTEEKCILLIESGIRLHTTASEWPKNVAPSGFSMKMRKHLRNKRLEAMTQLGRDRIVDLQFGSGEAAYHVILELYDRGNIILTDCDMTIINILRPHTEGEEVRFAVREKYPTDRAQQINGVPSMEKLQDIMTNAKTGEPLKKILNPHLDYGSALIEHVMLGAGFPISCKLGKTFDPTTDLTRLISALQEAEELMVLASQQVSKGFITQKREHRPSQDGVEQELLTNQEFHPTTFLQHEPQPCRQLDTFDVAVDEFFSAVESQKIDLKALQQEREAMKKLSNVRKDHDLRLRGLEQTQETDRHRAELITRNHSLVDRAILNLQAALAKQLAWKDIESLVKDAQAEGDVVACHIQTLKLNSNKITMSLSDPYIGDNSSDDEDVANQKPTLIDINLDLTAYANATRYYEQKRTAAKKQQKTIDAQGKALKSAERKTKQTLKEVQAITTISKARKIYWFEKFFWFISSENYLVIGGRDQQQNEMIVKRYMRAADVYVHADIQGASSVVVKNPSGAAIPPKTLNEAGIMAVSYSVAWDAKVVTSAWWVQSEQVSKTAPTGEYLTTGSFMVRGKKNYLPPCHLIMGFSFLFKLEESSVFRHKDERKVKGVEEELQSLVETNQEDKEIELLEDEEELQGKDNEEQEKKCVAENGRGDEGDEADEAPRFPDTKVRIEHMQGDRVTLLTTAVSLLQNLSLISEEDDVVYLGDDIPVLLKPGGGRQRNLSETKHKNSVSDTDECPAEKQPEKPALLKRGQKSKLKKIKEKYADQDEEERTLCMEILQSSGICKEKKVKKKKKEKGEKGPAMPKQKKPAPAPKVGGGEDSGGEEEPTVNTDMDMLVTLTGQPVTEDEILFAIPVVAPYSVLLNYKYKVKLTPGTGKRGKAARTAVMMFLKDRGITSREKDVIRSVKDELLARNLPGKVKLSAPQMQRLRK